MSELGNAPRERGREREREREREKFTATKYFAQTLMQRSFSVNYKNYYKLFDHFDNDAPKNCK